MPAARRLVLRRPFGPVLVVGVALGAALMPVRGARAQTDTTEAAPPDTLRRPPADTAGARRPSDTTGARPESLRPLPDPPPLYGRVRSDSLPGRRPHVSV